MSQSEEFDIAAGATLDSASLGFSAFGCVVDNLSNQWYQEGNSRRWIPPYSLAVTISLSGAQTAQLRPVEPPAFALGVQPTPNPGEYVIVTYTADPQITSAGVLPLNPILGERAGFQSVPLIANMNVTHATINGTEFPLQAPNLVTGPSGGRPTGQFEAYINALHWVHVHAHVTTADAANAVWVPLQLLARVNDTLPGSGTQINATGAVCTPFLNTGAANVIDLVLPGGFLQEQVPNGQGGWLSIAVESNPIPGGSAAAIFFQATALLSQVPS